MNQDIIIKSYNKTLRVNEQGDTITLDFDSGTFENDFYLLMEELNEKLGQMGQEAEKIDESETGAKVAKKTRGLINDLNTFLAESIETLFGEGTCKKVFGTETPGYMKVSSFIDQIAPYFKEYREQINQVVHKYNPERMGNA